MEAVHEAAADIREEITALKNQVQESLSEIKKALDDFYWQKETVAALSRIAGALEVWNERNKE